MSTVLPSKPSPPMSEPFDPYRKWLGIPPRDQPPHHYRLLGIAAFEDDPDVIENAAARQMRHLRTYQSSKHAVHSQRLLSEISAAKLCLLDPASKTAYDQQLRAALAAAGKLSSSHMLEPPVEEAEAVPEPELPAPRFGSRWREEGTIESAVPPPPVPIPMPPPPVGTAVMAAPPLGASVLAAADAPSPIGVPVGVPVIRRSSASSLVRARRKRSSLPLVITVLSLLALAGAGAVAVVLNMGLNDSTNTSPPDAPPPKAVPKPSGEKPKAPPQSKPQPAEPADDEKQSSKLGTPFPIGTALLPMGEAAPPQP
jgi:hypothetical protein